jgi:hypothetical protein
MHVQVEYIGVLTSCIYDNSIGVAFLFGGLSGEGAESLQDREVHLEFSNNSIFLGITKSDQGRLPTYTSGPGQGGAAQGLRALVRRRVYISHESDFMSYKSLLLGTQYSMMLDSAPLMRPFLYSFLWLPLSK